MKQDFKRELQQWQETVKAMERMPRSLLWGIRIALLVLLFVWIGGAVYLHSVVKADERELIKQQQIRERQEERLKREALYRQSLEQQKHPQNRVKNAVDGVK